jgi:fatty acid desaturase
VSRRRADASTKRWAVPLLRLLLGFAFLAAFWVAGNSAAGLGPFAIMLAYVVCCW